MTKLNIVRLYNAQDVPDELMQQISDLELNIAIALEHVLNPHNPSVIISALNRFHANMICLLVIKEGLENAAKAEAVALIKNIEHISGQRFFLEGI